MTDKEMNDRVQAKIGQLKQEAYLKRDALMISMFESARKGSARSRIDILMCAEDEVLADLDRELSAAI